MRERVTVLLVAAAAFAVRILVASAIPLSGPVSDMQDYWERAAFIATHGRLYDNSWRMPGYPAALAAVFAAAGGPSLEAARWFHAAAGAFTAVLTYWLARRSAGTMAATAAALIVVFYPSLVLYTSLIATEAVVTVPLLGALIAVTFSSRRAAALSGLCAACATLVRPASIALLPAVLITLFLRTPDVRLAARAGRPAIALVAFCIALAPWWAHNMRLHGRFVPLDTTAGVNLLIGTSPYANGHWDWDAVSRAHADYLSGVDTTTAEGSDRAAAVAWTFVREDPLRMLRLAPAKLAALLALEGREHAYLYSYGYFGTRRGFTVGMWAFAVLLSFPLLVLVTLAGCTVRGGVAPQVLQPCALFLLAAMLMHLVSFGDPRFHLPFVPVLAVLATGVWGWRNGVIRWRAIAAAVVLIWLGIAWTPQLSTYRPALSRLLMPDGSHSYLSFDDLLQ